MPDSCGSYLRMNDDDSFLTRACRWWGHNQVGKWGHEDGFYIHALGHPENRLFDHAAFVSGQYHWLLYLTYGWYCDDVEAVVSSGDFWKVFVR